LFERLEDDLAALPGVRSVTSSVYPLLRANPEQNIAVEGYGPASYKDMAYYGKIGAACFQTFGVPLISGREFTRSDLAGRPKVAIINEAFAKKFNLGRDAVGKHIGDSGSALQLDAEIIGVVQNAKLGSLMTESRPWFFRPYRQDSRTEFLSFYVRTISNPEQLLPAIKNLMAHIDPNLPLENTRTMTQLLRDSSFVPRTFVILSTTFSCLAILLAAVGIYGVLAYTVAQRIREIGLRMALGSSESQVRTMVLRQVGRMTIIGIAIGMVFATGFGRVVGNMLYKLHGSDPAVLCGATIAIALVALIAGFIPAYRASKIDPMQALRYE
jgi:predicted permease